MTRKTRFPSIGVALAILACAPLMAGDADKPKQDAGAAKTADGKDAGKTAQGQAAPEDPNQGLGGIGKALPLGQENLDVKIPSFKDGKPNSFVRAGSMTRIDDHDMDLKKTDIRLYGQTRADDLRVQLVTGNYDMNTQVLNSNQRSRVSRDDFQIEGDSLIFDTHTQQGKMTGNVKMVIYDANSVMKKPVPPPPGSANATGKEPAKPGAPAEVKSDPRQK